MRVTFLGTGTSHGVPMIGCDCPVCCSADPRNQRLRPSIYVEAGDVCLLVDPTPDFRTQALRAGVRQVDAVLLTHSHADHVLGLDDLRAFCREGRRLPVYGLAHTMEAVQRMFSYAFTEKPAWIGLPSFRAQPYREGDELRFGDLAVTPLTVMHGRLPVSGFLFDHAFAYLTDCHQVPPAVVETIRGVTVLAIDALRHRPHPTHLTIEQAVAVAGQVQPQLALLTHLCHEVDHGPAETALPAGIRIAYDKMIVETVGEEGRILNES